jgi:hypothetical protein
VIASISETLATTVPETGTLATIAHLLKPPLKAEHSSMQHISAYILRCFFVPIDPFSVSRIFLAAIPIHDPLSITLAKVPLFKI